MRFYLRQRIFLSNRSSTTNRSNDSIYRLICIRSDLIWHFWSNRRKLPVLIKVSNLTSKQKGNSHDIFYRYQKLVEEGDIAQLINKSRRVPNIKNRVDEITGQVVLSHAVDQPAHGQQRISNELRKAGVFVSGSGARYGYAIIWRTLKSASRLWKPRWIATVLSSVIPRSPHWRRRNMTMKPVVREPAPRSTLGIETEHPGYLGSQDTFYVDKLVGVALLWRERLAYVAYFHWPRCGSVDQHDYQHYLAINDTDHTKTKAMSSQTKSRWRSGWYRQTESLMLIARQAILRLTPCACCVWSTSSCLGLFFNNLLQNTMFRVQWHS